MGCLQSLLRKNNYKQENKEVGKFFKNKSSMNEEKVKEILNRSTEEIKDEIIPVVINAIMDAFGKGFEAGMKAVLNNDKSNSHEA